MAFDPQFVTVLHDYSGSSFTSRKRKSGKTHVTVNFASTPLLVCTDPMLVGKAVADAIGQSVRKGILAIRTRASDATLRRRKVAERALARGKAWARKQYAGGKTGRKDPNQSEYLFNDSRRFAEGVVVGANPKEGGWTVNVTANRLTPDSFRAGHFAAMTQRLVDLVPAIKNPLADAHVVATIKSAYATMLELGELAEAEHLVTSIANARRKQQDLISDLIGTALSDLRSVVGL